MIYKIADLIVKMETFGMTKQRAEKYIYNCENDVVADVEIHSAWNKIKHNHTDFTDDTGEYMCTGLNFYGKLLKFDGMMLHSSAVVVDNKAYLFTADSGVGKSTHTKNWIDLFGEKAFILNDDKPAVRFKNGKWFAFGTPWSGKHDINENVGVEIAGIAVVYRAEENSISKFSGAEATSQLLKQICIPGNAQSRVIVLDLLDKLITGVPVWKLECNKDINSARIAYEAMSGNK